MKQSIVIEVELDENNLPESINMNTSGDKKVNLESFLFSHGKVKTKKRYA